MANAGVKVTLTAQDRVSQTIERINARITHMQAPVRRVQAAFGRFASLSGLSRLNNGIVGVGRSAVGAFQSLGQIVPVLGTLTGAASVAGVYRLASAWAQAGTDLRTTSRTMGMAPQRLQAMQNAAQLAGGSAESMTGALQQLSQTSWAALHNQDPGAVAQFKAIGIHAEDLQRLSPDKLFLRVAASLRQIRSPAAQAVAAATLFGGAAQGLMPIFQQTNEEFENNIRLAERYGLFNKKGVDAADRLRKAQWQLGLAVRGFGNSLAESLEPAIRPVIEGMADWIAANRQWIAQDITSYVRQFITWLRAGGWDRIRGDIVGVYHAITNVVDRLGGWKSAGRDALIAIGALYALPVLAGLGSLATAVIAVATAFGGMRKAAGAAAVASRVAQTVGASPPGWNTGATAPGRPGRTPFRPSAGSVMGLINAGESLYEAHRAGVLHSGDGEGVLDNVPGWSRFNHWWNRLSGAATAPLDQPVQQMATALARHYGIDPGHYTALLRQEHGGYRNVSPAGAFGPSQLMPGTARALGIADSVNAPNYDWRQNLDAGARYYRQQLDRYHGDYAAADAAYNAGPNSARVQQFAQTHDLSVLPHETQGYVANIARMSTSTPPVQRIQVEIDHKNAPPGTRARVTNAPPGTRVVNNIPVQRAMPPELTPVGN